MRQFIIGGLCGIAVTLAAPFAYLYATEGPETASALWHAFGGRASMPEEKEAYMKQPFYYSTDYDLTAPFLTHYSKSSNMRDFGIYREEPVLTLGKTDFAQLCVSAVGDKSFDVAFHLKPEGRKTLLDSFTWSDPRFSAELAPDDGAYTKRYYIEVGGDRMIWFWVNEPGAAGYAAMVDETPQAPDFTLSVPFSQLYNFQYYLLNYMTDAPISACNAGVDLDDFPMWQTSVDEAWANTLKNR